MALESKNYNTYTFCDKTVYEYIKTSNRSYLFKHNYQIDDFTIRTKFISIRLTYAKIPTTNQ